MPIRFTIRDLLWLFGGIIGASFQFKRDCFCPFV